MKIYRQICPQNHSNCKSKSCEYVQNYLNTSSFWKRVTSRCTYHKKISQHHSLVRILSIPPYELHATHHGVTDCLIFIFIFIFLVVVVNVPWSTMPHHLPNTIQVVHPMLKPETWECDTLTPLRIWEECTKIMSRTYVVVQCNLTKCFRKPIKRHM